MTEIIEVLLVIAILAIQVYISVQTYYQIGVFRNIIPDISSLRVSKVRVPTADLKKFSPKEILANIEAYKNTLQFVTKEFDSNKHTERVAINIIETDETKNVIFEKILFSINSYLIRNHGTAPDFNLIKDIVERNTDTVEEGIKSSIGVPLYIGLMGTMLGIVIGLFNMPELGSDTKTTDSKLNEGIGLLIGGVKIAMIGSFSGLLLTIINSGWSFKGSRSVNEARKNEFYTFIQIELLPLINQGLPSTLESLQRNLLKFNDEFSTNLKGLTGIFDSNRSAIREQKELLDALDKAKVSEMTQYNVTVLKQLNVSIAQFEKFNSSLSNVTLFVENSQLIVSKTNELLERTDNFKKIADNLENKLNQSQQLLEFLSSHFSKLEKHKEFTSNAVADVGHSISETFKELKQHIQNSSEAVKKFTVDEIELLKGALSSNKTNLGNLEHLATLKSDVSQFKNSSASQGELLKQSIDDLNQNMAKSIVILEQIEKRSFNNKAKSITSAIKNFFKSGTSSTVQTPQIDHQEVKKTEVITQTFFLSTPNFEGSFNDSSTSSTYRDGATIYRFTKIGSNNATFQIDEKEASVKLALLYPDKNIDPVCEAVNAFNPNATHITTVVQGEAELQGNKWVVTKKAQIRYDN